MHYMAMLKYLLPIAVLAFCVQPSHAQKFESVNYTPGIIWNSVKADPYGGVVAVGSFHDTVMLGAKKLVTNYNMNPVIAKFDRAGQLLWSYSAGGLASEYLTSVGFDSNANVYVCGAYAFRQYFDQFPKFGGVDLPIVASNYFVAKFTPDGVFQWVRCSPDTAGNQVNFDVTPGGEVTLEASYKDTLRLGTQRLVSSRKYSRYLARLDRNGNVLWLEDFATTDTLTVAAVRHDHFGNSIVCVSLNGPHWDFSGHRFDRGDSADLVIVKISDKGKYLNSWKIGGTGSKSLYGFEVDAGDNMYGLCNFKSTFTIGDTTYSAGVGVNQVMFRLDHEGNADWSKKLTIDGYFAATGFAVTGSSILMHIPFQDSLKFEGRTYIAVNQDILTASFTERGKFKWSLHSNDPSTHYLYPLSSDGMGGLHGTGVLNQTATFGSIVIQRGAVADARFLITISEPTIVTTSPNLSEYCPGDPIEIHFTTNGSALSGFRAYLSDAAGSFDSAIAIGDYLGGKDSIIIGRIPRTTATGNSYRVRVSSFSSADLGIDNGPYFIIHPLPPVRIQARKPVDFCDGNAVPLTAFGGTSYRWSTGDTTASVDIGTPGWHYVTATNEFGCEATDSIKLTSHPYPVASVTASGPTRFCQGGQVTLTGKGGKTYSWSTGEKTAAITVKASGEYYVIVRGDGDCEDPSEKIVVTVYPTPAKPVITQEAGILTSSSTSGNEWYLAGGSKLDTTRSFKPTKSGKYYVRVTDTNGCISQSDFVDVVVEQNAVSAADLSLFEISPNPVVDVLEIRFSAKTNVELEIVDLLGVLFYREGFPDGETRRLQVSCKTWPSGVYYVRAAVDGQTVTRKLVKP